jgi:phosphoribosylcarboxyaminoimidazole (NCAIR) mutase
LRAAQDYAPVVGVIMGSDSDLPTMKTAARILEQFGVPFELTIVSAHRTPGRLYEYARTARARGLKACRWGGVGWDGDLWDCAAHRCRWALSNSILGGCHACPFSCSPLPD